MKQNKSKQKNFEKLGDLMYEKYIEIDRLYYGKSTRNYLNPIDCGKLLLKILRREIMYSKNDFVMVQENVKTILNPSYDTELNQLLEFNIVAIDKENFVRITQLGIDILYKNDVDIRKEYRPLKNRTFLVEKVIKSTFRKLPISSDEIELIIENLVINSDSLSDSSIPIKDRLRELKHQLIEKVEEKLDDSYSVMKRALYGNFQDADLKYLSKMNPKDLYYNYKLVHSIVRTDYINLYVKEPNNDNPIIDVKDSDSNEKGDFNAFQVYVMKLNQVNDQIIKDFVDNNYINWDAKFPDIIDPQQEENLSETFPNLYARYKIKRIAQGLKKIEEANSIANVSFKNLVEIYEECVKGKHFYIKIAGLNNVPAYEDLKNHKGNGNFNAFQVHLMSLSGVKQNLINKFISKNNINWNAKFHNDVMMRDKYPDLYNKDKIYFLMRLSFLNGVSSNEDDKILYLSKMSFEKLLKAYNKIEEEKTYIKNNRKTYYVAREEFDKIQSFLCPVGNPKNYSRGDLSALQLHAMMESGANDELVKEFIVKNYINWHVKFPNQETMSQKYANLYEYNNKIVMFELMKANHRISGNDILYLSCLDFHDLIKVYNSLEGDAKIAVQKYVRDGLRNKEVFNITPEMFSLNWILKYPIKDSFSAFILHLMIESGVDKQFIRNFVRETPINWQAVFPNGEVMSQKYSDIFKNDQIHDLTLKCNSGKLWILMKKEKIDIKEIKNFLATNNVDWNNVGIDVKIINKKLVITKKSLFDKYRSILEKYSESGVNHLNGNLNSKPLNSPRIQNSGKEVAKKIDNDNINTFIKLT